MGSAPVLSTTYLGGGGDTLTPPNNAYPLLPISPGLCFLDEVEEAS